MVPVWFHNIFPHYLINDMTPKYKKLLSIKVCFDFLYKFVCNISHSKKK